MIGAAATACSADEDGGPGRAGTGGTTSTGGTGTGGATSTGGTGTGGSATGGTGTGGATSTGGTGTGGATSTGGTGTGGATSTGGTGTGGATSTGGTGGSAFTLPPLDAGLDYQLGGAYTPPSGVAIVSRDREEAIAQGLYNICYVNGFQIQQSEESFWLDDHPDLVLRDSGGDPIVDADWDEMLIDVSTPAKRTAVAAIVGAWIQKCANDGFDAVEIDNLDTYSRSTGLLSESDNVAAMRLFSDAGHAVGLAVAQKNSAEIVGRRAEMGTDFVVAEECNRYSECDVYTGVYGDHVLVIEYRRQDFTAGCADFPGLSIVLRDRNLTTPSSGAYVYDGC